VVLKVEVLGGLQIDGDVILDCQVKHVTQVTHQFLPNTLWVEAYLFWGN